MAVLDAPTRQVVWRAIMRRWSDARLSLGTLTKADILAAGNAMDQWIEDNQASFNTAIPQPARAQLTAQQKAELFMIVIRARTGESVEVG